MVILCILVARGLFHPPTHYRMNCSIKTEPSRELENILFSTLLRTDFFETKFIQNLIYKYIHC
jgi:hypothetical protein